MWAAHAVSETLSALDATFLELEDGDRSAHMHIGGILVFDGPPPAVEALRSCISMWRSRGKTRPECGE